MTGKSNADLSKCTAHTAPNDQTILSSITLNVVSAPNGSPRRTVDNYGKRTYYCANMESK